MRGPCYPQFGWFVNRGREFGTECRRGFETAKTLAPPERCEGFRGWDSWTMPKGLADVAGAERIVSNPPHSNRLRRPASSGWRMRRVAMRLVQRPTSGAGGASSPVGMPGVNSAGTAARVVVGLATRNACPAP
jgi:hypothetical protein